MRASNLNGVFVEMLESRQMLSATIVEIGTLGGDYSEGFGINNRGEVAGFADTAETIKFHGKRYPVNHAFVTSGSTVMDLGRPQRFSGARNINDSGQVVGVGETDLPDKVNGGFAGHAMIWSGGSAVD